MENLYSNLHHKYSLSKTLRFELIPEGKTRENIEKNQILKYDEVRSQSYKRVKKYCDEYHKIFIDKCMSNFLISTNLIDEFYNIYKKEKKTNDDMQRAKEIQKKLRKEISERFQKDSKYKGLFTKDMINSYLKELYKNNQEKINDIEEFNKFVTYFSGFNQNRKNMYTFEEKSTAIAYRLINQNLPIFISNYSNFNKIKIFLNDCIKILSLELQEYIQVNKIEDVFMLNAYNDVLTQKGIELYNLIITGKMLEDGTKIKGLNEYINEYNQKNNHQKLPKLKQLYKQILSERIGISFVIESINSDKELVDIIQDYYDNVNKDFENIESIISNIKEYNLDKIYLNNNSDIAQISQDIFDDWTNVSRLIKNDYNKNYNGKNKISTKKYEKERIEKLKKIKVYSISYLDNICDSNLISEYLSNYISNNNIIDNIYKCHEKCKDVFEDVYTSENMKKLIKDENSIEKIKNFLDSIKRLQEYIKLFLIKDEFVEKDEVFYSSFIELYNRLSEIIPIYNKVRNYLTQKPYSTEKIKLNFENDTLLSGWDLNKEKDNLGVLFEKDNNYYLGIINPQDRKIFDNIECIDDTNCFNKMEYKLLPGPNKMLPKVFFSKSRIDEFNPSKELLEKYEEGCHKKGEKFDIYFCRELIDFYKKSINKHEDWKKFNFEFKNTNEYNDIGEFYKDVEKQGYKIGFKKYSEKYINELVERGSLYLFKIYSKDFSIFSKGMPNLHTLYWKELFDEDNLKNIVYKLNGQAEIFFRKASLTNDNTVIHKKNEPISNKNILNSKKESVFNYDLIKNRRYTLDKFYFHVPITMNFISDGKNNINEDVNKFIKENEVNVIGIDRGERNLLYLTVINPKGEIIEQYSLNEIVNRYKDNKYKTDYHKLLDDKEKEREFSRESWKTVENIKELKEGYLSQVIHKIIELLDKYKAIIVIEDLNKGFKNSRIKVEKQVYQKFEKMLIDKLNYLVIKNKDKKEAGGLLKAWQLTNSFESFQKIGKQTGILFYIPAWCTSKIDPTTGFINLFQVKYESVEKSKEFFKKFDYIKYNNNEKYYEFYADYLNFTNKSYGYIKDWTICTYGERIELYRNANKNNNWDYRTVNLTYEIEKLFEEYTIDKTDIKNSILNINEKDFWYRFTNLFKLTVQLRNSVPNSKEDFLISPVKNKYKCFYDSREVKEQWPLDADANGAYNIARKGLMLIEQIKNTDNDSLNKVKFNISNEEWLKFVQEKSL